MDLRTIEVKNILLDKKSYLRWGAKAISKYFNISYDTAKLLKGEIKEEGVGYTAPNKEITSVAKKAAVEVIEDTTGDTLIIPDLHLPFEHKDSLEFLVRLRDKWQCENIISVGDVLDLHFSSFHGISTRAKGADEELELARKALTKWKEYFPEVKVCTSNHDSIPTRKAEVTGLSSQWIKDVADVLNIPGWKFQDVWDMGEYVVIHGTDGKSIKNKLFKYGGNKSIIQGHFHTNTTIEYFNNNLWGMQLGALIDKEAYAFEYAKNTSRGVIMSAGIIKDSIPIIETLKV